MSLTRRAFLGGGALLCLGAVPRAQDSTQILTATDVHVSDYPTVQALRWIGDTLAAETGGRIRLRILPVWRGGWLGLWPGDHAGHTGQRRFQLGDKRLASRSGVAHGDGGRRSTSRAGRQN